MFYIKKQVITCDDCPHMGLGNSGIMDRFHCLHDDKPLPLKGMPKIPEWCSLNNEIEPE
jgi:hypothetical protein